MSKITYRDIVHIFKNNYPDLEVRDYRPFPESPHRIIIWIKQKSPLPGVDNHVRPVVFQTDNKGNSMSVYEY